eukprot:CAMPEP_0177620410 /NCGR_PEP_ID=MMETSP0419_2-20121207/26885_1 /TAXON_ID=582737 /ORGANISM="Tetraselmis sp., Strain GSL018" /LENGTH=482 /DNA_ID=CAMNT_0019119955 /DNA_START=56 /DNA_END=1505 /DNA_ORIENTATION=-
MITTVLFDLDGTLIDTETLVNGVASQVVSKYGKSLPHSVQQAALGKRPLEAWKIVADQLEIPKTAEELFEESEPLLVDRWQHCKTLPGAVRLVDHLFNSGVKLGIVTSSLASTFERKLCLKKALASKFGAVITGDCVEAGKPSPEGLLAAAKQLGSEPEECLVIEDAPVGFKVLIYQPLSPAASGPVSLLLEQQRQTPHIVLASTTLSADEGDFQGLEAHKRSLRAVIHTLAPLQLIPHALSGGAAPSSWDSELSPSDASRSGPHGNPIFWPPTPQTHCLSLAGMRVVAVPSLAGLPQESLEGCTKVLASLLDFHPDEFGLPPFGDVVHGVVPLQPVWKIKGPVVRGFGRGSATLGIPTANLPPESLMNELSGAVSGIYCGFASVGSSAEVHKMVMSIGWNPFFNNKDRTAEPWILHEFAEPFYGEELRLVVCGYIRPEANFTTLEALIARIHEDARITREALSVPELDELSKSEFLKPVDN